MMREIRVVIVEDEPAIVRSIQKLIARLSSSCRVVGTAFNGQDGLAVIEDTEPDIVFTDIRMPLMSGLEMIEQAIAGGFGKRFVILSGYAEFDYARKAMGLGVTDYLLKPINPREMESLLRQIETSFSKNSREARKEYITRIIAFHKDVSQEQNPYRDCDCCLLFSYYGPVTDLTYEELSVGKEAARRADGGWIPDLEERYGVEILMLKGFRANEVVYIITMEPDKQINMQPILENVWEKIQTKETYTNLIISKKIRRGQKIAEIVRDCSLFILYTLPFGRSACGAYTDFEPYKAMVSEFIIKLCKRSAEPSNLSAVIENVNEAVNFWEQTQVSQIQLQTDLRYYTSYFLPFRKPDCSYPVSSEEILAASNSFPELRENIILELRQLLQLREEDDSKHSAAHIVYQLKSFLDENYSKTLSGKTLSSRFGYNENYLSALFKAEFGITPSKYISERRIALAKYLMQENPDILMKDVAAKTGYGDVLYFTRVFRNREGISPGKYRKNIKEERKY